MDQGGGDKFDWAELLISLALTIAGSAFAYFLAIKRTRGLGRINHFAQEISNLISEIETFTIKVVLHQQGIAPEGQSLEGNREILSVELKSLSKKAKRLLLTDLASNKVVTYEQEPVSYTHLTLPTTPYV